MTESDYIKNDLKFSLFYYLENNDYEGIADTLEEMEEFSVMTKNEQIDMLKRRVSVLKERGETMNSGIIAKVMRKIRMLENEGA